MRYDNIEDLVNKSSVKSKTIKTPVCIRCGKRFCRFEPAKLCIFCETKVEELAAKEMDESINQLLD